jgi:hypothetical protein
MPYSTLTDVMTMVLGAYKANQETKTLAMWTGAPTRLLVPLLITTIP